MIDRQVIVEKWITPALVAVGLGANLAVQVWTANMDNHVTAAQVQSLTAKATELTQTMREISERLAQMPRPDEIAEAKNHFSRIDQTFGIVSDRIGRIETNVGIIEQRIRAVETPIYRNIK